MGKSHVGLGNLVAQVVEVYGYIVCDELYLGVISCLGKY
jgi:hypothetical protein